MIINKAMIKIIEKTLQLKMQDIRNEDALLRAFIALYKRGGGGKNRK